MTTQIRHAVWGFRSVSFWLTLLLALGIIFVGGHFIMDPAGRSAAFGIPFRDTADQVYGKIKGIRDIFSGVVLLPFLWMRMRKAAAWALTAAILVPATDCLIVYFSNGIQDILHLSIHGGTALVMVFTSILLFRNPGHIRA